MRGRQITLTLTVDEQRAFFGEFAEPYGRDIRLGVLGKIRDALGDYIEEPAGDPQPEQSSGSEEGTEYEAPAYPLGSGPIVLDDGSDFYTGGDEG